MRRLKKLLRINPVALYKAGVVIIAEMVFLIVMHFISFWLNVSNHVTTSYVIAGVLVAYLSLQGFEHRWLKANRQNNQVKNRCDELIIELQALKLIVKDHFEISDEQFDSYKRVASKENSNEHARNIRVQTQPTQEDQADSKH